MNGRTRILETLHGRVADRVPFAPNLHQWFYYHQMRGTLPRELSGAEHPFDALRVLGADILARWEAQYAILDRLGSCRSREEYSGNSGLDRPLMTGFRQYPAGCDQYRRFIETPLGTLSETWRLALNVAADFQVEFLWKSWDDYKAIRYLLEARDYAFDAALFGSWVERLGNDGVMMAHITQTPLKTFHWLAGAEETVFLIADHPREMKALADIHTGKALRLLRNVADRPEAEVFVSLENLDSMFYTPALFTEFCAPFFHEAAELIHSRGKTLVAHACGRNRVLLPLAGAAGIDCLEGLTPPPAGDVDLGSARRLAANPAFIVNGGMDTAHLEIQSGNESRIHQYTRALFDSMGDKRNFIFASSCNTSVLTPWRNLTHFRDAAREYGVIPDSGNRR